MPSKVSLFDLADLSIGSPDVGSVNFHALHTLLHAIIKQLNIENVQAEVSEEELELGLLQTPASVASVVLAHGSAELLTTSENATHDAPHGVHQDDAPHDAPLDAPHDAPMDAAEDAPGDAPHGATRDSPHGAPKDAPRTAPRTTAPRDVHKHGPRQAAGKTATVYHQLEKKVQEIERQMAALNSLPTASELMERSKSLAPEQPAATTTPVGDMWQMIQMKKKVEGNEHGITKAMAVLQDLLNEINAFKEAIGGASPEVLKNLGKSHEQQQKMQAILRAVQAKLNLYPDAEELKNFVDWEDLEDALVKGSKTQVPSKAGSASERFPDTVEALRNMGDNSALIKDLLEKKADRDELYQLKELAEMAKDRLIRLPEDMGNRFEIFEKKLEESEEAKEKWQKVARFLDPMFNEAGDLMMDGEVQMGLQLAFLSSTVKDIEQELKELRKKQDYGKAKIEQSVAQTSMNLQEQLNKLRSILQGMVTSSSTLLALSMQPPPLFEGTDLFEVPSGTEPLFKVTQDAAEEPSSEGLAIHAQGTCPACSIEVSEQVSQLVSRYEQLQELVNNFMAKQAECKPLKKTTLKSKDGELLSHIQTTILQLQEECEKLNGTTGNLIEDHQQKQRHIDILYQSLEKLEEKKADKDHLEMDLDVKADKRALESKVSRSQFDATNEHLNQMMLDLLDKVTVQEVDWQKMVDKMSTEMETKLDRLELDPFKKQLEDRWKSIRKQLKDRAPTYESDEAAGIRKQLIARFHCISCDRPVDMTVPGPQIVAIPSLPGLPCHRSVRPHTVYELEQVRQQNKSVKAGLYQSRCEAAQLEKSVSQLRRIHSRMRMEIEKVQVHFGGSVRASTQAIRELLHARCISLGQSGKRHENRPSFSDRIPEMPECGVIGTPRSCGGSHTLTFPHRRYSRLQNIPTSQNIPQEEESMLALLKQEEVDILGLDGHIYRGRMDNRFPAIPVKEASKTQVKASQSVLRTDSSKMLDRPRSAKSSSTHVLPRPLKDRPVSSHGRFSQSNMVPPPSTSPQMEEVSEYPSPQVRESVEVHMQMSLSASARSLSEDESSVSLG